MASPNAPTTESARRQCHRVASAIISGGQRSGNVGIGFAIPINLVRELLPQLHAGKVTRGRIGVGIGAVPADAVDEFGLKDRNGAVVLNVAPGGAAARAGVEPGDVLVGISKRFRVPYEVLMRINGIRKAEGLRAGETIKVLRGPFHAKIFKSKFRLDVYLQDVYVRSFPVGLGGADSTPEGAWKVKNRQPNPTYYPPASAKVKRIIPADDPDNPLGEHWIGLDGVSSGALGKIGYGIHGTITPESIGKGVSLGCVRMHNKDVEFLFGLLQIGHSTVTILP